MARRKKSLTPRQRKLIKARVEGKTFTEAAKVAGYSSKQTAHRAMTNADANKAMRIALHKAGLTPQFITEKVRELFGATRLYGKEGIEHADNQAQLGAVEVALKITGAFAPQKVDQSAQANVLNVGGVVNISVQQLLAQIGKLKRADRTGKG